MYYVYVIRSQTTNKKYIGYTSDLKKRLEYHNKGYCDYTSKYLPWTLEIYIAFNDKIKAHKFEKYLKSGSGSAFTKRHF